MLRNLESIALQTKPAVETFFSQVVSIFQQRLDSIYLYGSVVTKDFQPGKSDINSLVLIDRFAFDDAKVMQPLVRQGLKDNLSAPLIMGLEMFERSADTFPLEFIQIQENHAQIMGNENRVQNLVIPREHLRLKIEEQIKGKLIRLREVYMEMSGKESELVGILVEAQRQLFPVFRNFIRFQGVDKPPVEKEEILTVLDMMARTDLQAIRRVWEHNIGKNKIATADAVSIYGQYVEQLTKLAELADRME